MQCFITPENASYYILLQRTALQLPVNRYFRLLRLGRFYDKYILRWFEILRKEEIARLYTKDIHQEYDSIKQFLPERAGKILDIGCGIAGIDLLLYRHYHACQSELSLLDKDLLSEKIYYGYKSSGAFYNSLSIAQTFLTANAVPSSKILIYDPDADGFPRRERFDLIISLISWGFHYPVETYLEEVHGSLADDGVLILDLRKGTDGRRSLAARFASVETIVDAEKYERVLVRK
jgi:SAM-dependent methyltransferase